MEHDPWVVSDYEIGLNGQRIAILGYSHWSDKEDSPQLTRRCIHGLIDGTFRGRERAFFTRTKNYFAYSEHRDFWPRVMFFNFLPTSILGGDRRFSDGTYQQRQSGRVRFRRLIEKWLPHKVLVFTGRHWAFAEDEKKERLHLQNLGSRFPPNFGYRSYFFNGHRTSVFFLRHPQGASAELMGRTVRYILDLPRPGDDKELTH